MPDTYLLLRNNKQTGPLSLQDLLQQGLTPQDLIWVEGQSVGWGYPSEIPSLKQYMKAQAQATQQSTSSNQAIEQKQESNAATVVRSNSASHIYVSLPAGTPPRQEAPVTTSLEAKAEALYQRVQAFSQGQAVEDETETRYAKSLDAMKHEYGAWLVQQKKKKKQGSAKKKLLIAASVLVITTSGYGIIKWIQSRPASETPLTSYALGTLTKAAQKQPAMVSFQMPSDSFTSTSTAPVPKSDTTAKAPVTTEHKANTSTTTRKKTTAKTPVLLPVPLDTILKASIPAPEKPAAQEVKKNIPLSRLVIVSGELQYKQNSKNPRGTQVTLQNNSTETLKSVSVVVNYFKKEDKQVGKEMVYFFNVAPGSAPVVTTAGNRKATSVRFTIGTITRADGSLYFIH